MPCLLCGEVRSDPVTGSRAQMVAPPGDWFSFVRCAGCGLIRLDPTLSPDELSRYYDQSYLPHRGPAAWGRFERLVASGRAREDARKLRWARRAVHLGGGSRVLDLGCGLPTFLARVRAETGAEAVGVDPSPAAWDDSDPRWTGLTLHRAPLDRAPLHGAFDLMTMWHALEHDDRPLETLRRLRALAAPDGALVVEVPDYDSLTRRLQGSCWAGYSTPRHTMVFTPATLRRMLEAGGWRVERIYRRGSFDPYVLWWLGRQEQKGRDLTGSLELRFAGFVAGKVASWPVAVLGRFIPLGVQLAIARR